MPSEREYTSQIIRTEMPPALAPALPSWSLGDCANHMAHRGGTLRSKSAKRRLEDTMTDQTGLLEASATPETEDDEAAEIRYSLTALGEAVLSDRRGRFRGFGPCMAIAVA